MAEKGKKVILAMSGGVDSSVAAALLRNEGYDVTGVFMRFQDNQKESIVSCQNVEKIGRKIGIPVLIFDAQKDFKKKVIDYFLDEYQKGRTPNPCVACNQKMKFSILMEKMKYLKADFIATGHYAWIKRIKRKNKLLFGLLKAMDKNKDQSYFLYTLNQKELSRLLLPLGGYTKNEVKKIAKNMKLPIEQKESQDICFIRNSTNDFLKKYLNHKPGIIFDETGKILGRHMGLPFYTLGQRKGINIGGGGPYYVIGKNFTKNSLTVTNHPSKRLLYSRLMEVKNVNWTAEKWPEKSKIRVKIRYRSPEISAIISSVKGKKILIKFQKLQKAVTPGQSAVFYDKEGRVLGGGIIKKLIKNI